MNDKDLKIFHFKKIIVIGTSGSGKSTFSKKLAYILGYPYIEMDKIFWEPDWTESSDEIFFANLNTILNQDKWVLDGNYSRTIPIKWEKADEILNSIKNSRFFIS